MSIAKPYFPACFPGSLVSLDVLRSRHILTGGLFTSPECQIVCDTPSPLKSSPNHHIQLQTYIHSIDVCSVLVFF